MGLDGDSQNEDIQNQEERAVIPKSYKYVKGEITMKNKKLLTYFTEQILPILDEIEFNDTEHEEYIKAQETLEEPVQESVIEPVKPEPVKTEPVKPESVEEVISLEEPVQPESVGDGSQIVEEGVSGQVSQNLAGGTVSE